MAFRFRNTFTRPNTSVDWPFKNLNSKVRHGALRKITGLPWLQANRSETVQATWVSDTEVHVDLMFADRAAFDDYIAQQQSAGVGTQFQTTSWENIENEYNYTYSFSTGFV